MLSDAGADVRRIQPRKKKRHEANELGGKMAKNPFFNKVPRCFRWNGDTGWVGFGDDT
jgi:hypothetical protein